MKHQPILSVLAAALVLLGGMVPARAQSNDIRIGNLSASSYCVPIDCNYKNTVAQFIYTASELGGACDINSISFYHTDTPDLGGGNLANDRNIQIYLSPTYKTTAPTNWCDVAEADLVFSADITVPGISGSGDWFTITFDEPYHYYGTANLAVIIITHSDVCEDFHHFLGDNTGTGTSARSVYKRSDVTAYDIHSLPSSPSSTTFRPCVKLGTSTYTPPVWDFGDTMAYCGTDVSLFPSMYNGQYMDAVAVKYPASMMAGRNSLSQVRFYVIGSEQDYTLIVTQEESNGEPVTDDAIWQSSFQTDESGWIDFDCAYPLDDTKPLWLIIENNGNSIARVATNVHDDNAQMIHEGPIWGAVTDISGNGWCSNHAWPLYAITSPDPISTTDCNDARQLPFTCGFEVDDTLDCWTFVDADNDGYNWGPAYPDQLHHSGDGSYASASYINLVGRLTPDNWMITPPLHIPDEGATLQWFAAAQGTNDFEEVYGVQVSTTTNDISAFTTTIYYDTIDHGRTPWDSVAVSLSQFAGQDIYIAFRHYNCTYQFHLLIDDISVTADGPAGVDAASAATVTLAPNPTTGVVRVEAAEHIERIEVYSLTGSLLHTATGGNTVNLGGYTPGTYMLRVITAQGACTKRVVLM